jgi:hypothetical protein
MVKYPRDDVQLPGVPNALTQAVFAEVAAKRRELEALDRAEAG